MVRVTLDFPEGLLVFKRLLSVFTPSVSYRLVFLSGSGVEHMLKRSIPYKDEQGWIERHGSNPNSHVDVTQRRWGILLKETRNTHLLSSHPSSDWCFICNMDGCASVLHPLEGSDSLLRVLGEVWRALLKGSWSAHGRNKRDDKLELSVMDMVLLWRSVSPSVWH